MIFGMGCMIPQKQRRWREIKNWNMEDKISYAGPGSREMKNLTNILCCVLFLLLY